jgi:hypothetical protein
VPCQSDPGQDQWERRSLGWWHLYQSAITLLAPVIPEDFVLEPSDSITRRLPNGGAVWHNYEPDLCALFTAVPEEELDKILYRDARDRKARDLADWWEGHQEWDRKRRASEAVAAEKTIMDSLEAIEKAKAVLRGDQP